MAKGREAVVGKRVDMKADDIKFDYFLIRKLEPHQTAGRSETRMKGCWEWTGKIDKDGYGRHRFMGRSFMAHRWVWECVNGWLSPSTQLDHLCKNRRCVNPAHLEPVSQKENISRARNSNSEKTHCPQGHRYTELNTYHTGAGKRKCRACARERAAERRAREKADA